MPASRIFRKSGALFAGLAALALAGCANTQAGPVYGWQSDAGIAMTESPSAQTYASAASSSVYTTPPYSGEASHPTEEE